MKNSLDNLPKPSDVLSPRWLARLRTGATLAVLAVVFLVGVSVGVNRVTDPFPQAEETPICTQIDLIAGDVVEPAEVTVSVINAGGANGLAGRTLSDLSDEGFGRGQLADAPKDTPRVVNSQIWTTDGPTAAVRLVRSYLKGEVRIVERPAITAGITVVVGEKFRDLKTGKAKLRARDDETTCAPSTPAETPIAEPTEG